MSTADNVDKLVTAQLLERDTLSKPEIDVINAMSREEVDTIINAASKFRPLRDAGVKVPRVFF